MAIIFYYSDHEPPHFHVRASEFRAKFDLNDLVATEVEGHTRPQDCPASRVGDPASSCASRQLAQGTAQGAPPESRGSLMLHRVKVVRGRPDFTIEVLFEHDERVVIDLSDFVATGEVTAPLRADPGVFVSSLRIVDDGEAIGWPGEVEIDADALWYKAHPEDWEHDYGALRLREQAF